MNEETVKKLNEINKNFYQTAGSIWNPNPDYYWEGWDKIFANIQTLLTKKDYLRVLDIGCGNARFYNYLKEKTASTSIKYTGLDFSSQMLGTQNKTCTNLDNYRMLQTDFVNTDLEIFLAEQKIEAKFDLIVAFGVFHHIPGSNIRQELFQKLSRLHASNGLFIFTTWQFLDVERLKKRVVDRDEEYKRQVFQKLDLQNTDFEEGDYILDWVKKVTAYRYAHYFQPEEIQSWLEKTDLQLLQSFVSDGRTGRRNRYYVCKK